MQSLELGAFGWGGSGTIPVEEQAPSSSTNLGTSPPPQHRSRPQGTTITTHNCHICFEDSQSCGVLWGSSNSTWPKRCMCDLQVCIPCLRDSAKTQIRECQRVTCPNVLNGRRCTIALDLALLDDFFSSTCPLCDVIPTSKNPLITVGCALDAHHRFCVSCVREHVLKAIEHKQLPKCPRSIECRFQLDEAAMRTVLGESEMAQEKLWQWHDLLVQSVMSPWHGNKPCPTPNCVGYLTGALDIVSRAKRGEASEVRCDKCLTAYCWTCANRYHHHCNCVEALETTNQWIRFLKSVANDGAMEGAKEGEREVERRKGGNQDKQRKDDNAAATTTNIPNNQSNISISELEKRRLAAVTSYNTSTIPHQPITH